MVIAIENHLIAFVPVPKAACTSVKSALTRVDASLPGAVKFKVRRDADLVHRYYQTSRFRGKRMAGKEDWYRFTVVRDPVRRLLSVYTDRVVARNELASSANLRRGRVDLPMDPDPDFFFRNLDSYREYVSVIRHHARRQSYFTGTDIGLYDRVYTTSEIDQLAADLSEITGEEVEISRLNVSSSGLTLEDLSPDARAVVEQAAADDYKTFSSVFKAA
ncbi:MAG: sulfotransferase family 2 domain-containing protein [Pseudomonadota bacterium]|nr:sulfotransferase family 2 domain-containing protein [Pseudomonadota bacterium]